MHFPIRPIDLLNGAPLLRGDLQVFNPIRTNWQTWVKPKGVSMCFMMAIGGGAGGGGGFSGVPSASLGGGGGGGAGGVARFLAPAFFLPENLFIQVGEGGAGGPTNATHATTGTATNGTAGGISYISLGRSTANPNLLFQSSATQPGGGNGGGQTAAGAGGTAPTAAVATNALLQLGIFASSINSSAGAAGGPGGTSSLATTQFADGSIFITPGAGGGNASAANQPLLGGSIIATAAFEFLTNGGHLLPLTQTTQVSANTLTQGGRLPPNGNYTGSPGMNLYTPFIFSGGGGGQSTSDQVTRAGDGGRGGIGCGGGGGGSAQRTAGQAGLGGTGGPGGPGLVIIYSW